MTSTTPTFNKLDFADARFLSYALAVGGNVRILKRTPSAKDGSTNIQEQSSSL